MELKNVFNEIYKKILASFLLTMLFTAGLWQGGLQVFAAGQSPIITYPAENQVVSEGNEQITWDAIPGVSAYNCEICDLTSGSTLKWINFYTSTSYRVYAGHSYRFSVMANDSEPWECFDFSVIGLSKQD